MIDHARLTDLLHYDPETGIFTWKSIPNPQHPGHAKIGKEAGAVKVAGYIHITIFGKAYAAHRLAWFYMTKAWPPRQIDHRNTRKADNRWDNLRIASPSQNAMNRPISIANTSGVKGVSPQGNRWVAMIYLDAKPIYLGLFETIPEAEAVVRSAREEHHGEFTRH